MQMGSSYDPNSKSANELSPTGAQKEKLVFLNTFLRNQIDTANAERKTGGQPQPRANDIIEEASKLRTRGATDEDLMDYVKS
jgi:hypothetical protein